MKEIKPLPIDGTIVIKVTIDTTVGEDTQETTIYQSLKDKIDMTYGLEEVIAYESSKAAKRAFRHVVINYCNRKGYDVDTREGAMMWRTTCRGLPTILREPGDNDGE